MMTTTTQIQTFEIYGTEVHMSSIRTIQLTKIGKTQYTCGDDWTWNKHKT
jgi:hypothetical protein